MGRWRSAGCALPLLLIGAGCAQPSGPAVVIDRQASVPRDHWTFSPSPGNDETAIAAVVAADGTSALTVGCTPSSRLLGIAWIFPYTFGKSPALHLSIAVDGGAPAEQQWFAAERGFALSALSPGYLPLIDQLRSHHDVEFTAASGGQEATQATFTLNGADSAI